MLKEEEHLRHTHFEPSKRKKEKQKEKTTGTRSELLLHCGICKPNSVVLTLTPPTTECGISPTVVAVQPLFDRISEIRTPTTTFAV